MRSDENSSTKKQCVRSFISPFTTSRCRRLDPLTHTNDLAGIIQHLAKKLLHDLSTQKKHRLLASLITAIEERDAYEKSFPST